MLFSLASAFGVYAIATVPMATEGTIVVGAMTGFYALSSILLLSGKVVGPHFVELAA